MIDSSPYKVVLNHLQSIKNIAVDSVRIAGQHIESINDKSKHDGDTLKLYFNDAIIFPGLINSHDHLDFDLFPKLGNKMYEDYLEWGKDIHSINKETIKNVLKIPKALRIQCGVYKNLLAGVTTVVHHGNKIYLNEELINIHQQNNVLHSVQLEQYFKLKLNNPFAKPFPFVIHIGEGVNKSSYNEINKLIKWNFFKRELIGVHGIAMTIEQSKFFKALVWCPDSNLFLQHKTALIDKLKKYTNILFGTDSTVSADWNIWHQLRLARSTNLLNDDELYKTVSENARSIWHLNSGMLKERSDADLVVAKRKNLVSNYDAFFAINPEDILLVMCKGKILLFDESISLQLNDANFSKNFSKIYLNGYCKYVVGDLSSLIKKIKYYSPEISLPIPFECN